MFAAQRPAAAKDINTLDDIPAGSNWSTRQLFSARLLIRSAGPDKNGATHMLPALCGQFDETVVARKQPRIQELLEGPDQLDQTRTETELVHQYGASLGLEQTEASQLRLDEK